MNDILLSAKMLHVGANTPITITQSATNGSVTFDLGYSAQFSVVDGKLNIASIATSVVEGLDESILTINNSLSTLAGDLNTISGKVSTAEGEIDTLQGEVTSIAGRVDALEAGTIDLSNYVTNGNISLTAKGDTGISFVTTGADAQVTVNGQAVVTEDQLEAYQLVTEKNAANGYAGLDASAKLLTAQLPIDADTITVQDGVIAVNAQRVAVLNASGKIGREYLDSINIQETFGATIDADGNIVIEGGSLADVEIGDAIIIKEANGNYKAGAFYYRASTTNGNISDFTEMVRDITSATAADVNAGESNNVYITPAALAASAPAFDGANITNINGAHVSAATADTLGTVKVTNGNGLDLTAGVISMGAASASKAGAVVLSGKGIAAGENGAFDVALVTDPNTLKGDGGATALEVKLDPAGAIVATANGIKLDIDTESGLLAIENNKLVNKAVAPAALVAYQKKQARIAVNASNYNSDLGKISFSALEYPKGIRNTVSNLFVAVLPTVGAEDAETGLTTYTFDVQGFTALNEGSWEIVF